MGDIYEGREIGELYDRIADEFARTRRRAWPSIRELSRGRGLVLDLGCGTGRNAVALASFGYSVVAADLSIGMLNSFRERCIQRGILAVRCDALHLPFREEAFDSVAFVAVIHHIKGKGKRLRAMAEIRRVTKGGGCVLVTAWSILQSRFLKRGMDIVSTPLGGGELGDVVVPWGNRGGRFYHLFTKRELERTVSRSGFKIIKSYGERIRGRLPENWIVLAEKA
ncbi:MAG: class I SAM-dependent methyltransferase [Candidatus Methanosuratus sp.]|nr:class I SAM-dependent methyltransferase [Candidatus Methanosuratincola sp.]